jgi:predicted CoA-binding protein
MNRNEDIDAILTMNTMAIVGCSADTKKASNHVASYLKEAGYRVIPVHPDYSEVIGEKCYPSLSDIKEPVDVVVLFRRSEFIPPFVNEAVKIKAKAIWMQDGVVSDAAAKVARDHGLRVIMDDCIMRQHSSRLGR